MKWLIALGALALLEYVALGLLAAWYAFCDWRERRKCWSLAREFERVMGR